MLDLFTPIGCAFSLLSPPCYSACLSHTEAYSPSHTHRITSFVPSSRLLCRSCVQPRLLNYFQQMSRISTPYRLKQDKNHGQQSTWIPLVPRHIYLLLQLLQKYFLLIDPGTTLLTVFTKNQSQDPDLVINQFLAWLHLDPSGQSARAPAEIMLLKSKPHFVRCRELQSQASRRG